MTLCTRRPVRLFICAPEIRTASGSAKSIIMPKIGKSMRTCSSKSMRPPGRITLASSRSPRAGSGTEQNTNVATAVSKQSSEKGRFWTSASRISSRALDNATRRCARASIRGLRSTPVTSAPAGWCSKFSPVPAPISRIFPATTRVHRSRRNRRINSRSAGQYNAS
jgi:hypothetical protein